MEKVITDTVTTETGTFTVGTSLLEAILLLEKHSERLREAGVKRLQVGDVIVDFEAHFEEPERLPIGDTDDKGRTLNPFEDDDTFGEGGGYMPGFRRLLDRDE